MKTPKTTRTRDDDTDLRKPAAPKAVEGETITQHKQGIDDPISGDRTMENIGKGSYTETAPAVRGETEAVASDRIVQQGDDVVLISHNPINGLLENPGKVLKINQDKSLAIRVALSSGGTQDFTGVGSEETTDSNPFWKWPA